MGIINSVRVLQNQKELRSWKKYTNSMKLSLATMVAVAAANDKKVPPRHPLNRLNKIKSFSRYYGCRCRRQRQKGPTTTPSQPFEQNQIFQSLLWLPLPPPTTKRSHHDTLSTV